MDIALSVVRWVLAFMIGAIASVWVLLGTIGLTIGNRDVTKHWLDVSGIYDNALTSALRVSAADDQTSSSLITPDVLRESFSQTFDPAYLRQSVNSVIDATYDWLEGKSQAISFSIPVQAKADAFRANLTALLIPKLQALPVCAGKVTTDTNELTCLPAGVSATDYANQLTRPSSSNTFLAAPLTEKTFEQGFPQLGWLPISYGWLRIAVWALPLAVLVLGGLYILATPDKLRGMIRLGRQLTINASITLVSGLFLWLVSGAIDLSQAVEGGDPLQAQAVAELVNPLVRTILPDIGRALTLCSGVVVMVGGLLWLGGFLWARRRPSKLLTGQTSVPSPTPMTDLPEPQKPPARKIDL